MLKEFAQYLSSLSKPNIDEINGLKYSDRALHLIKQPETDTITVSSLKSFVDYIKANIDKLSLSDVYAVIDSPTSVVLQSKLNDCGQRFTFFEVSALLPKIIFNQYLDSESFNIMLQSQFLPQDDREVVLKVVGNLKDEAVKKLNDDGTSQKVTIKTGISTLSEAKVPNPVILRPYSTFAEIEQPERLFVLRMRDGGQCALFEADGGAWRNKAIGFISEYLKKELQELNICILA